MSSHWSRPRPVLTCDWCSVTVGADADLVIWDAKQSKTISSEEHLSKCDVNIFQDLACSGGPEFVIFKGRMVLDQGTFRPMTGFGEYLPLPPFSPHVYDKLNEKRSAALSRARPVTRTEEDMAVVTNGEDAVPPEVTDTEDARPANQQEGVNILQEQLKMIMDKNRRFDQNIGKGIRFS